VAGPARSEVPDEGCKVREMSGRDLCGGCQMLQAICRKRPRRVIPEDLSDPSLLGAGEHGADYRSRTRTSGPAPPVAIQLPGAPDASSLASTSGRAARDWPSSRADHKGTVGMALGSRADQPGFTAGPPVGARPPCLWPDPSTDGPLDSICRAAWRGRPPKYRERRVNEPFWRRECGRRELPGSHCASAGARLRKTSRLGVST